MASVEKSAGLNACQLKIIAASTMLIDHVGFFLNYLPFRIIGRLAFPIFLFLIVNGYRHTSSPLRYALRLGIFAIVSQVPFSLFAYGRLWSENGNVFFTLLAALLCIWAADGMGRHRVLKWLRLAPGVVLCILYLLGILRSDYGARAILMAMVFFFFDGKNSKITLFYMLCLIFVPVLEHIIGLSDGITQWDIVQMCSVFALPLIFRYNGQKGTGGSKWIQYGFYLFYPLHLLVLWLIF